MKSSASGLMLMCAFLIGAFSPLLLGILKPILGLATALSWLWLAYCIGAGLIFIAVICFFKKDAVNETLLRF